MEGNNELETILKTLCRDLSREYIYSTVLWRIENLGHWEPSFHCWEIRSPEFRLINLQECNRWTVCLFPMGDNYDENNGFRFGIRPTHFVERVSFVCEWSILDSKESIILKKVGLYHTKSKFSYHVVPEYPTYHEVFVTRRASFLPNDTLTMKLRICNIKKGAYQTEYLSVLSRTFVLKDSFEWRIKGFSSIQLDEEIVKTINVEGDLYDLNFALKGESLDESMVKISVATNSVHRAILFKLRLSLTDKDVKDENCMEWTHVFHSSVREHMWVLPGFTSRREVLGNRSEALGSDDLTLIVEWTVSPYRPPLRRIERLYYGPKSCLPDFLKTGVVGKDSALGSDSACVMEKSCRKEECMSLVTLGEDLRSFFREGILSDFELRSEDNKSFPVHKLVLSARSPVFKAMFCDNVTEEEAASGNSMDIPDLDASTLNRLVTFIYSGTIDHLEWENAAKLYYAADKYEIPSLKQKCSSVLRSNIDESNVPDILELADTHKDKGLMSSIHNFLQGNFNAVVLSGDGRIC